ncbi:MAG: hypothetical protein QOK15_105 [Nocardioidaceae bacterium]|nr:hypothetical protein [Nocardioidaceae bacterium]
MAAHAFFRRLAESSSDGLWAFDLSGRTLYTNAAVSELLGRSAEELSGLNVLDVLTEPARTPLRDHLEHPRNGGADAGEVERRYLHADGSEVLLAVAENPVHDEDGTLVGYLHRLRCDTGDQTLVHELSRSRAQLDEAQAITKVASWEQDLVTGEVSWSRQMFTLLGLDPEVFTPTSRGFLERVLEDDRELIDVVIGHARHGRIGKGVDFRIRRTDGEVAWVRGHGQIAHDGDGSPTRIRGTLQDITDVKAAELKLVDAVVLNAFMQVVATAANESATLAEALKVTHAQLLAHGDWQRAVAFSVVPDPSGDPRLDQYSMSGADPAATDLERRTAHRVLAEGTAVFEEEADPQSPLIGFLLEHRGEPFMVIVVTNTSPFERHEMLRAMVGQIADQLARLAERESASRQLAAARDAAMQASQLKSQFLATMSHEIRTPMNGVIGLNELLLRTDLDQHQRRLASGMQLAGRTLLGLINDILDFSKIEAGELELEVVDFDVRETFHQVAAILEGTARDKEVGLQVEVGAEVPERLVGDPTRLGQVVSNLVSNAVKFTDRGDVRVSVEVEQGGADDVGLRVEVSDTGVGMTAEQVARLFEPFRQADASTTRTFGGTGLGLAISKQLVTALGGEIGVHSEAGAGSRFWFTGRFGRAGAGDTVVAGGERRSVRVSHQERPSGHVLVVEDNDINQLVALGLLEALGYTADVAVRGDEAVELARRTRYDAVLMDVQMPGMDGYAASRLIRHTEARGTRVPIIAMTASAIEGERERCLEAGMDDFLTKPVDTGRLESLLRTHVAEQHDEPSDGPAPGSTPGSTPGTAPDPDPDAAPDTEQDAELQRESDAAPALVPSRLEELDSLGERAMLLVDRAIDNFVRGFPETLAELRDAVARGDLDEVRTSAHRLRGSALNLGAARVAEVGLRIELWEESSPTGVPELLGHLEHAGDEAAAALRQFQELRGHARATAS